MNEIIQTYKYASFFRRLCASIADGIIVAIIGSAISLSLGRNPFGEVKDNIGLTDTLLTYLVTGFYYVGLLVKHDGQTIGKRLLHIKVIRTDGKPMDPFTAILRYIGYFVSQVVLMIGYLWYFVDSKKQTWHDKIAKTYVIESDDQKPNQGAYLLGCLPVLLIPLLFIAIIGLFSAGLIAGLQSSKNSPSLNTISQGSKSHYERSQQLFSEMKNTSDPEKAKILNDENIIELKQALDIEPNNARIWYELGNAYTWVSTNGTLEDQLLAFKKAAELEPESVVYINGVGDAYSRMGKYEEAILEFQKTLRLTDKSGYANLSIATAYKNLKIYVSAKEHYQKAIEIFTDQNSDGQYDKQILEAQKEMAEIPQN